MKGVLENMIIVYGISDAFPIGSKAFKQLQFQDIVKVSDQKPEIEQIVCTKAKIEITNTYIMNAASGCSCEGQVLTGRKLIVEGKLHQKLEYAAKLPGQPIHAAHIIIPISTFIVLGEDIDCYTAFEVSGYIEDISIKQIDIRNVFINVLLVLNAVPECKI